MEEIDARLTEAEQVKANWTPVQDLVIDSLSEQMDDLKVTTATVLIVHRDLLFGYLYPLWSHVGNRYLRVTQQGYRQCKGALCDNHGVITQRTKIIFVQ